MCYGALGLVIGAADGQLVPVCSGTAAQDVLNCSYDDASDLGRNAVCGLIKGLDVEGFSLSFLH